MKDWTGNSATLTKTLGSSAHSKDDREEHDYYATDPIAVKLLCEMEKFSNPIWEPACGEGHISDELKRAGYEVYSSDLIDRGYGEDYFDFLQSDLDWAGDIITNPPYKYAQAFVEKALKSIRDGNRVAMFLRLQFLEGKARGRFFKSYPPKIVYVSRSRLGCPLNGDFSYNRAKAVAFSWFIWEKGYRGDPIIRWFN